MRIGDKRRRLTDDDAWASVGGGNADAEVVGNVEPTIDELGVDADDEIDDGCDGLVEGLATDGETSVVDEEEADDAAVIAEVEVDEEEIGVDTDDGGVDDGVTKEGVTVGRTSALQF